MMNSEEFRRSVYEKADKAEKKRRRNLRIVGTLTPVFAVFIAFGLIVGNGVFSLAEKSQAEIPYTENTDFPDNRYGEASGGIYDIATVPSSASKGEPEVNDGNIRGAYITYDKSGYSGGYNPAEITSSDGSKGGKETFPNTVSVINSADEISACIAKSPEVSELRILKNEKYNDGFFSENSLVFIKVYVRDAAKAYAGISSVSVDSGCMTLRMDVNGGTGKDGTPGILLVCVEYEKINEAVLKIN